MEIHSVLQSAVAAHQAGDLDSAGQLYATVLQAAPASADAWHLSGVLALQLGRVQQAIDQIELALQLEPTLLGAWTNLASAQLAAGHAAAAEGSCRAYLQSNPQDPRGWMLLANAVHQQDRSTEALPLYQHALELAPDDPLICCNYGSCLLVCGQLEQARDCLQRALTSAPRLQEARVNLGAALRRLGDLSAAEAALREVLAAEPEHVEAIINLANVLREQSVLDDAAELAATAIRLAPDNAKAWNLQGLISQGRADDEGEAGSTTLALDSLRKAAELAPDKFVSPLLFAVSHAHESSPEKCCELHKHWAAQLPKPRQPLQPRVYRDPHRPLRIGLMSGDFGNHAISRFLMSWLPSVDQRQYPLHLYSELELHDDVTAQYQQLAHRWLDTCGMSDEVLAEKIHQDQIDVLIDLAGHTGRNRLAVMNWRPAPVQMTFLGYPNTTGLESIDYFVTDQHRDPPGCERYYSERLLRLDGPAVCFAAPQGAPDIAPAPVDRRGWLTFGSLHRLGKLNRSVARVWAEILGQFEHAKLLIVRDTLKSPAQQQRILRLLTSEGIPGDWIELRGTWQESHLEHYADIDLLLPVFPWGGGTTTYEAMWMGVLPLAVQGGGSIGPASKAAAAALRAVGLDQWLAADESDLARIAQQLATSGQATKLRRDLRQRMLTSVGNGLEYAERVCLALREASTSNAEGQP